MKVERVARVGIVAACIVVALGMVSSSMAAGLAEAPAANKGVSPAAKKMQKDKLIKRCPDLSADRIEFGIVSKTGQFKGKVRVVGVVKNVGNKDYKSSPHQQSIVLYQGNKLVSTKAFQNLAVNQEERIVYERDWDASSPSEGEFPPEFKLALTFDPDISMDGNLENDECNSTNNHKTRSGADINALFRP